MSAPDRARDPARQPELSIDSHRGIFVPGDYYSSNSGVGVHWSANKQTAEEMGSHAWQEHATGGMGRHPNDKIVMFNADIPMSSIETNNDTLKKNRVLDLNNLNENREAEVPVKKGASVFLKSKSTHSQKRSRTRRYNPPRRVSA